MPEMTHFTNNGEQVLRTDAYGNPLTSITWSDDYKLYFCPVCGNVTLTKTSVFSEDMDEYGRPMPRRETLYPILRWKSQNMPRNVSHAFEAAIRVRHIDGAICLLSLRRTLEMMCRNRGATHGTLYDKLRKLSHDGTLPPIVESMATVLKTVGNAAAHADDTNFSDELVESMIDFTQTILDYVYHLPQTLEDIQGRLTSPAVQESSNTPR
jgi:hypothetical protein